MRFAAELDRRSGFRTVIIVSSTPNPNRKRTRRNGAKPRPAEQVLSSLSPHRNWWYGDGFAGGTSQSSGPHGYRLGRERIPANVDRAPADGDCLSPGVSPGESRAAAGHRHRRERDLARKSGARGGADSEASLHFRGRYHKRGVHLGPSVDGRRRYARKDDDDLAAGVGARVSRAESQLPDRRSRREFWDLVQID